MARRNKPAVQRYHDRVARRYDASYRDAYWQFHDALTWEYLKPFLPSDQSGEVLDLGCGTGKWALKLLKSGFRVACVDISGAMVERARSKITEVAAEDRAAFVQADLCDLSALSSEHYTFAVALGDPIGCTRSPAKALKEIRKRLVPGAVLVATLDNKLAALDYYLETGSPQEMRDFLRRGKTHWLTREENERFDIHTFTPAEAVKLFENAGFEVLEVRGKTVLDLRRFRHLLEDPAERRTWSKIERSLSKDADAIGRAGHLQIAARVRGGPRARG